MFYIKDIKGALLLKYSLGTNYKLKLYLIAYRFNTEINIIYVFRKV